MQFSLYLCLQLQSRQQNPIKINNPNMFPRQSGHPQLLEAATSLHCQNIVYHLLPDTPGGTYPVFIK